MPLPDWASQPVRQSGGSVGFRFSLVPREVEFFALYMATTGEIKAAAIHLKQMFETSPPDESQIDIIRDAEHRCDTLTHDTIQRLHRTFITPFDREDLYAMATSLDNVMDAIDHAASLVRNYRITVVPGGARELVHIVTQSADRLHAAMEALSKKAPIQPHTVEINRLENEADRAYQKAIQALFEMETDPIGLIKSKDLLDVLEQITDCCEDVANVIESIVVKHG
jgi:predicted phosphate transport protein (TIGR00153 family)